MPDFDSAALAQLDREVIKPKWFIFLDVAGDPLRATTADAPVSFVGTGDADLDGYVFDAFDPTFVDVSEVRQAEGGTGTVTASLSGLILPDNDLLNTIGDKALWQGRSARLWMTIHDETGVQQGAVVPYYGGFMSSIEISGDEAQQTIEVVIETWTASLARASGRTYLDQAKYDPGDLSAEAAISIFNGTRGTGLTSGTGFGSASGSARDMSTTDLVRKAFGG